MSKNRAKNDLQNMELVCKVSLDYKKDCKYRINITPWVNGILSCLQFYINHELAQLFPHLFAHNFHFIWQWCTSNTVVNVCIPCNWQDICVPPEALDDIIRNFLIPYLFDYFHTVQNMWFPVILSAFHFWLLPWPKSWRFFVSTWRIENYQLNL